MGGWGAGAVVWQNGQNTEAEKFSEDIMYLMLLLIQTKAVDTLAWIWLHYQN